MDGLVTEIHRLRSLKSLLAVRELAKKAYTNAWFAQDKLQYSAKQWRDKGRADKADQLEPKIAEAMATLKRMKVRARRGACGGREGGLRLRMRRAWWAM
jgi:hypothetical protein